MKKDPTKVAAAYKGILEKNKTITSPKRMLIEVDWERWFRNTVLFFAPAFLLFLNQLVSGKSVQEAAPVLYLWLLNTLIDVTRKYLTENTYKPTVEVASVVVKKPETQTSKDKK